MSRIGDKIKEERQKIGLTPKQLGKKCGVNESYILEIEAGKKIISEKLLAQISKVLGKSLEDNLTQEPRGEEVQERKIIKQPEPTPKTRHDIEPVGQWEGALSGIIKKIPIYDGQMKELKGYRTFPIIDKKVDGYNPDKLVYVEVPDQQLIGFRISKGDHVLIYLNQEPVNHSLVLVECEGKLKLTKLVKQSANSVELITNQNDLKSQLFDMKDIRILGRGIRLEVDLKRIV